MMDENMLRMQREAVERVARCRSAHANVENDGHFKEKSSKQTG